MVSKHVTAKTSLVYPPTHLSKQRNPHKIKENVKQ